MAVDVLYTYVVHPEGWVGPGRSSDTLSHLTLDDGLLKLVSFLPTPSSLALSFLFLPFSCSVLWFVSVLYRVCVSRAAFCLVWSASASSLPADYDFLALGTHSYLLPPFIHF